MTCPTLTHKADRPANRMGLFGGKRNTNTDATRTPELNKIRSEKSKAWAAAHRLDFFMRNCGATTASGCIEWVGLIASNGYGKFGNAGAHRTSWIFFNGPIGNGLYVCHKCDNRKCVNIDHLFLGTQAENLRDMCLKGRKPVGEKSALAKITDAQAYEIKNSTCMQKEMGKKYGITQTAVSFIRLGKTWKHIARGPL